MTTINEFIQEKKNNFANFLSGMFPSEASASHGIQQQIQMIRDMQPGDFIVYCQQYVAPHRHNDFDDFIGGLCVGHGQDINAFKPEDVAKCRRYLMLFCDITSG